MPRDPAPLSHGISALPESGDDNALPPSRPLWLWLLLAVLSGSSLYLLARQNYLLFHVLVELFSIVLAAAVFTIGWNARSLVRSPFFLILATGFLATGLVDLLHTLSYKGMAVFPVAGSNLSIQLWIVARALEAATFLVAALHIGRPLRFSAWFWLWAFLGAGGAFLASVWPLQIFPTCFVDGEGLTMFKIACEYLIAAVLAGAAVVLWRRWEQLGPRLGGLLLAALLFNIASELSFTLYTDPYGTSNFVGHLFKLITVVLVYHALVEGTLRTPYGTLFRELTALNRNLDFELQRRQRSEAELRAANHEMSILYRAAQVLHSTLRMDALTHLFLSILSSLQGGGFRRAMLFTVNGRTGVLQGMLGIDHESAALVLPVDPVREEWTEPQLDAVTCAAQRATALSQTVMQQRLPLAADDNPLAQACLERRLVLVENAVAEPPGGRRLATELGLNVYACAPLSGREEPFAALLVDLEGDEQTSNTERLRFLEVFTRQAMAAFENARLLYRLEETHRELREVQEQLIQGEKLTVLGEMAAQLAHELRNPMVSVGGFAQRLAKIDLGNERATEYAAIIAREVRRLEEMLDSILVFSKQQMSCMEDCNLDELLAEALELETELRQNAGISLMLDVVAPLPALVGDCRQLRQVLLNLLANARQAMPSGGVLTVRAERCSLRGEDGVVIEVEDTGGGIPADIVRNIFNPFFSTHPKGTGLGLSLSHRVIEQHHGQIEVVNGVAGARFIVRLPLRPPGFATSTRSIDTPEGFG
jgi:signal transduction histidine kinase